MLRGLAACLLSLAGALSPALCDAQSEIVGAEAFEGKIDLRASLVNGETGWLDGQFGKLRQGGDNGSSEARLRIASIDLAWKPRFSFALSGLVSVTHQSGQSNDVDINEAYLKYRSGPAATRLQARAGIFWPPISQEHGGSDWGVVDSITPSAINSWVGEEIKVLGLEAAIEQQAGEHNFKLTGALFRQNDMAGTLLSYRGWALHDLKVTMHGDMPLPPLSPMIAPYQDEITTPWLEVDDRPGYYARFDWEPPAPVSFNVLHYDNRGDRVSSYDKQTSWRTRFWNLGAALALDDRTVAKSQVMWGNTLVGPDTPYGIPVDVDFVAAYLLVSRELGKGKVTLRGDWFRTCDNSFVASDNNNEHGWAAMAAYKHPLSSRIDLLGEVIHVSSTRQGRSLYGGIPAEQGQTQVQASLRVTF